MPFSQLGLSEKVVSAVAASGYTTPTPIQQQAIPHVLARRDVLGIAQTGTGKTAAFTLPMLTMLESGRARARMPRTLILEPTCELAAQVQESFEKYGAKHKLNVALLIGGVSFDDLDSKLMRGVDAAKARIPIGDVIHRQPGQRVDERQTNANVAGVAVDGAEPGAHIHAAHRFGLPRLAHAISHSVPRAKDRRDCDSRAFPKNQARRA